MTLYDFNRLSLNERATYLWEYGEFFSSKRLKESTLVFYTLLDYYVVIETIQDEITNVRPFRKGKYLDAMIEDIKLVL
jgi:hypothetical protein